MTTIHQTIFKNTIWLSAAEIISSILLFFFTIFVAKYLGAEKYGQLAFALSIATLFAVLIDFGLGILTIREVARDRGLANIYLSNIFTLRIFLSIGFLLLMLVISLISGKGTLVVYLIILTSLYMVFNHLMQACNAIFRAFERMKYEAIGKFVFSSLLFIGGLALIWQGFNLIYFGWVYTIAMLVAMIYSFFMVRKYFIKIRFSFDVNFWQYLFKEAWPFALSMIFISIYYFMDSVMLGFMGQDKEVGWYNAGYKIVFFVLLFAQVFGGVIFPLISRYYKEAFEKLKPFLSNFLKLIISVAIPLGVGGTLLGREIIELIFGEDFMGGVTAFKILIWTAVIIYISVMYANSLQAFNRQKIYVKAVGFGALINVIMNLILIPIYSLNGAAVATLLAELSVFIFMYYSLQKIIKVELLNKFTKPIIASIIMAFLLFWFNNLHVLFLIFIGIIVYLALMILIRGYSKDEIFFIFNLFKSRGNNEVKQS